VGKPTKPKSKHKKNCNDNCNDNNANEAGKMETVVGHCKNTSSGNDANTDASTMNSVKPQKTVAETVAEGMTTFISTITSELNSLHSKLIETQEAVLQLTAQLSEIQELRDAVVQLTAQQNTMKELRDAVTSAHRSEVRQLRDVVQQQLTTQRQELKQLRDVTSSQPGELKAIHDAVNHLTVQVCSSVASLTSQIGSVALTSSHNSKQSTLKPSTDHPLPVLHWRPTTTSSHTTAATEHDSNDIDDFDFPPPTSGHVVALKPSSATEPVISRNWAAEAS
jgi:hypothetical protein